MSALALTGLRIWDGVSEAVSETPQILRIEGEYIAAIGQEQALCQDAEVIDFEGAYALPGLIDAHVHLTLDPEVRSADAQLALPLEDLVRAMQTRAEAMLRAGITTARDLGGAAWHELELRDRIASGQVPGPRLLCVGQPITSPRGHCWFWGGESANEAQIRETVRRQVEHGADWIKVMATGGVITKGTDPRSAQFPVDQMRALVEEPTSHGRSVAAHCHGTEGISHAAQARVRTIEHCSFVGDEGFASDVDPQVIDEMARAGIWASPTLNTGWKRFIKEDGSLGKFGTRMQGALRELRTRGVHLIASTDAGIPNVHHHHLPNALAVFARFASLTPVEALRSATSESARALLLDNLTGALRPGLSADVLIVEADPTADLAALQHPRAVFARGRKFSPAEVHE